MYVCLCACVSVAFANHYHFTITLYFQFNMYRGLLTNQMRLRGVWKCKTTVPSRGIQIRYNVKTINWNNNNEGLTFFGFAKNVLEFSKKEKEKNRKFTMLKINIWLTKQCCDGELIVAHEISIWIYKIIVVDVDQRTIWILRSHATNETTFVTSNKYCGAIW